MKDRLTKEEVLHVANLARISLTEEEVEKYQVIIKTEIENWIKKILGLLRQFGFTPQLNDITILGGGSLAFEKFSEINKNKNVTFIRDIRANAKGYEYLVKRSKAYRDR